MIAIGIDMKIPRVPKRETVAQMEKIIQNGCIPTFAPINLGVIKLVSMKGITK